MKRQNRLTSEAQELQGTGPHAEQAKVHEFASVEEMLRHDALHTPVPPAITHRLQESIRKVDTTPSLPSWWRRIFGGANR